MTNKELQEKLKELPDNLKIIIRDSEWGYVEIKEIKTSLGDFLTYPSPHIELITD